MNELEDTPWTQVPEGWPAVSTLSMSNAKAACLRSFAEVKDGPVHLRLVDYYDTQSNHPGTSFIELDPSGPTDVTVGDLLAVSLLGSAMPPVAIRWLLGHGGHRLDVLNALRAMPDRELYMIDEQTLMEMERLTEAVLRAVQDGTTDGADTRALAIALCARKHPDLFPVADPSVSAFLGLGTSPDERTTWQVMRHVLGDREVLNAIETLKDDVERETVGRVLTEPSRLRVLFATLATYLLASSP